MLLALSVFTALLTSPAQATDAPEVALAAEQKQVTVDELEMAKTKSKLKEQEFPPG